MLLLRKRADGPGWVRWAAAEEEVDTNLPKARNLREGSEWPLDVDRQRCWEYNVSVCLAGRCGYRATLDGPEFVDRANSGGKGARSTDSRRRSDV